MNIIYDIALVIVIAGLLVFIMGWAYDWGFKANENYKLELEHMVDKEQFINAVLEEGLKMNSEVIESLVKRKNELEKTHAEQARALRELANENLELKQKEVYNNYNLDNALISLNIENQRLRDDESRGNMRIKELENVSREQARLLREMTAGKKDGYKGDNEDKIETLKKIIEPIEEWINENACPHDKLIITQGNVEFTSGEFGIPLKIRD